MNNIKNEYDGMVASSELRERIGEIMNENKKRKAPLAKTALKIVACAAIICIATANIFPSVAIAAEEIPVLRDIVRIVTLGRYENRIGNAEADINIPMIEGLRDSGLQELLNREFAENADALIKEFEKGAGDAREAIYLDYEVRSDHEDILSLDVIHTYVGASAAETHRFYNIDKKEGKILKLSDMFGRDADFGTPISGYIKEEIRKRNADTGLYFEQGEVGAFEGVSEDTMFYINEGGNIVIVFDEYEIAAGAAGSPEFEIPASLTENIG